MSKRITRDLQNLIFSRISRMKIETINHQIANCNSLTNTNCGWLEYKLVPIVKDVLKRELELKLKKQKAKPKLV